MSKDKPVSRNKTTKSLDFREAIMTRSKLAQELGWNPLADTDERRELSSENSKDGGWDSINYRVRPSYQVATEWKYWACIFEVI
jgi:hypothetical protein